MSEQEQVAECIKLLNGYRLEQRYWDNGKLALERELLCGKWHGTTRHWGPSGILRSETQYEDGIKHGHDKFYNIKGRLVEDAIFEFGVCVRHEKIK